MPDLHELGDLFIVNIIDLPVPSESQDPRIAVTKSYFLLGEVDVVTSTV